MTFCEYCTIESYAQPCMCLRQGAVCPFTRRCNISHKWLPLTAMDKCTLRQQQFANEEVVDLKNGEYKVAYVQKGKLYIEVGDSIIRIANPYDYIPKKVNLIEINGEMYIKEFAPKQQKIQKSKEDNE